MKIDNWNKSLSSARWSSLFLLVLLITTYCCQPAKKKGVSLDQLNTILNTETTSSDILPQTAIAASVTNGNYLRACLVGAD